MLSKFIKSEFSILIYGLAMIKNLTLLYLPSRAFEPTLTVAHTCVTAGTRQAVVHG